MPNVDEITFKNLLEGLKIDSYNELSIDSEGNDNLFSLSANIGGFTLEVYAECGIEQEPQSFFINELFELGNAEHLDVSPVQVALLNEKGIELYNSFVSELIEEDEEYKEWVERESHPANQLTYASIL